MHIYDILKRPISTEKSMDAKDFENKYTFEVDMRANKLQVADAVSTAFDVDVENVRIMVMPAKTRRVRRGTGIRKPKWKKAIVELAPGQNIPVFEGG